MRTAEVQHFLGFLEATDDRAGEAAATEQQGESRNFERLFRGADQGHVAVTAEQIEIGIDVVIGGDGIEDEVSYLLAFRLFGM